jgi:UDP-2,3-diacylglucosamine pyrophosphatase LpxH
MAERTPVQRRDHDSERQLLVALTTAPPDTVLAVSDLHLGVGRDPVTGTFAVVENFFADEAFGRMLDAHAVDAQKGALLILNGDILDVLRVTAWPQRDQEYRDWARRLAWLGETERAAQLERLAGLGPAGRRRSPEGVIDGVERTYGLKTDDYKSVWKFDRILAGHVDFVQALATWVGRGGRIVVVCGNHDPELYWPLVRLGLRDALLAKGAAVTAVNEGVAFADRDFTLGNLYVEHGNQYESMTRIEGGPLLARDPTQINLPLGSFVNRYIINKIERLDPFLDNVKPVQDALIAIARRRPLRILTWYFMAGRFIRRALAMGRYQASASALLFLATIALPVAVAVVVALTLIWPEAGNRLVSLIPFVGSSNHRTGSALAGLLAPVLAPFVLGAVRELYRDITGRHPRDLLAVGAAARLAERLPRATVPGRVYAVMGHTHQPGVWRLSTKPREEFYVNTGTWIPEWASERPDLMGRVVYSLARFRGTAGHYLHELLEWNDDAGRVAKAKVLAPADDG